MAPFFDKKERWSKNIIISVKTDDVFTQIMMFSLKKVDNLRVTEQEREKKREQKFQAKITLPIAS